MKSTTDRKQLLNGNTSKVAVYVAEYPAPEEQRRYAFENTVAFLLASLLVLTAFAIS